MAGIALHDTIQQVVTIAYGIWRKRWYALATACLISAVGWALVYTIPYKFESVARVQINADAIIENITRSSILTRNQRQTASQSAQNVKDEMTQRKRLEKIIRSTNYFERLATSDLETNRLIADLKRNIRVAPSGDNIYTISYENDDERLSDAQRAEVVRDVVSGLVSIFISEASAEENVDKGLDFVDERIATLTKELRILDDQAAGFKKEHLLILSGDSITGKLEAKSREATRTKNQIEQLDVTVQELQRSLAEIPATISTAASARGGKTAAADPLEERIQDLKSDRDKMILTFTERHPDVRAIDRQIEKLNEELAAKREKQKEELQASADAGKKTLSTDAPNPIYEKLATELLTDRAEMVRLKKRYEQETKALEQLRTMAEAAPGIEAEYNRMRDKSRSLETSLQKFENERQNLLTLDQKNEVDTLNFKVLDEPLKPLQPSGPPRLLYLTFPLIGGLIAGIGVAFVLSQIKPVIITVDQLRHSFDMPVLGNVTRVLSEKDSKAQLADLMLFGLVGALLIVVYTLLVLLDVLGF